ncbi:DUF427 domain-containing protein [Microvirga antarctica]|uniref:DUF427 domain-containing protein n=1 Tax=Microvirga antarctica TaxID=2819233 RepID=UPI001B31429A|nr:DUF427 domain-containing protein [Microvirga antarctica]
MTQGASGHSITITENPHRIRVLLGGFIIAETTAALTLREGSLPPVQYIPRQDAHMDLLEATSHRTHCPFKGDASYFTASAGGLVAENAVWSYETPREEVARIAGYLAFYPGKVDAIEEFAS